MAELTVLAATMHAARRLGQAAAAEARLGPQLRALQLRLVLTLQAVEPMGAAFVASERAKPLVEVLRAASAWTEERFAKMGEQSYLHKAWQASETAAKIAEHDEALTRAFSQLGLDAVSWARQSVVAERATMAARRGKGLVAAGRPSPLCPGSESAARIAPPHRPSLRRPSRSPVNPTPVIPTPLPRLHPARPPTARHYLLTHSPLSSLPTSRRPPARCRPDDHSSFRRPLALAALP